MAERERAAASGGDHRRDGVVPASDQLPDRDDTLTLLFLCCHPALSVPSQLALTLRAVGGLTTGEIAKAFLVPEATMAQRISRAKQRIRETGARFDLPPEQERAERLRVVLHVLYLVFNEGYAATAGPGVARADLTTEAIRLTRLLHRLMPADGEVAGLLALMLLTDARRAARADEDGSLVPLAKQRRELWNVAQIEEGVVARDRDARDDGRSARISSKRRSPRSTTKRRRRRRPTGRRSSRSTRSWSASRRAPSSR